MRSAVEVSEIKLSDKIYWSKVGFGALAGVLCIALSLHRPHPINGVFFAIFIYLLYCRYASRLFDFDHEDLGGTRRLYMIGIGGFFLTWLVAWILLYTLFIPPIS